ncbi:MAG: ABC transporter permease subunit [Clostridia bacterium]|nr:ABC transporter permease subunit [Clostridia bacterium]
MKVNKDKILNLIFILLPFICLFTVWQIGSSFTNEFILPSLFETLLATGKVLASGKFYLSLLGTLIRTVIAFAISFLLAFLLAFWSRASRRADVTIAPVISVFRALPTIAVVLLLLMWTNSFIAPIVVTSLVVLPTTYSTLRDAFFNVDGDLIKALKLFEVDQKTLLKKVYAPSVLPSTLLAIGSGLSLNLKLMVAAEVIAATANSLGFMLNSSKALFETAKMIAIVLITVVIGLIVELTFKSISKKVGAWQ